MPSSATWAWFTELRWQAAPSTLWVGGLRLDRAQAWDYRNPALTAQRNESALPSGFVRWERPWPAGPPPYIGLGHVQRFPRLLGADLPGNGTPSRRQRLARLKPEKTTQLDLGATGRGRTGSSGPRPTPARCVTTSCSTTRAGQQGAQCRCPHRRGGAGRAATSLHTAWTAQATLASSWGRNSTDGTALPDTAAAGSRAWAWTTPRVRGLPGHCGAWWLPSTVTP